MPVEDPTVEWPPVPEGRHDPHPGPGVRHAGATFGENLSFTPWHALPEHRPLGGINRARKAIYRAISRQRHELNGIPRIEPTA